MLTDNLKEAAANSLSLQQPRGALEKIAQYGRAFISSVLYGMRIFAIALMRYLRKQIYNFHYQYEYSNYTQNGDAGNAFFPEKRE